MPTLYRLPQEYANLSVFRKSPSSFARSQSEEYVESFGPCFLQKHNVNHLMCVSLSKFTLSFRKKQKKKKKKEKKRKTSYSSQYIIWTIFGTWKFFCEGMWIMWCVFHFQSSYSHSGKNKKRKKKKRKERLHAPVNILYELFLARGNFFAKVNDP